MSEKRESFLVDAKDGSKKPDSYADLFGFIEERLGGTEDIRDPSLPHPVEVHQIVEDGISELPKYIHQGYTIAIEPFEISIGKCAVVEDTFGTRLGVLDKTDGSVKLELSEAD